MAEVPAKLSLLCWSWLSLPCIVYASYRSHRTNYSYCSNKETERERKTKMRNCVSPLRRSQSVPNNVIRQSSDRNLFLFIFLIFSLSFFGRSERFRRQKFCADVWNMNGICCLFTRCDCSTNNNFCICLACKPMPRFLSSHIHFRLFHLFRWAKGARKTLPLCRVCKNESKKIYHTNLPDMRNASNTRIRTTKAKETRTRATETSSAEEQAHPYIMFIFHAGLCVSLLCSCVIRSSFGLWNLHYLYQSGFYLECQTNTYAWPISTRCQTYTMLLCAVWQLHCIRKALLLRQNERDKDETKSNWTRKWNGTENVWRQQNKNEK